MRKPRRLPLETLAPCIWQLPEAYRGSWGTRDAGSIPVPRIDWKTLFGNDHPVEIEVGFGKGLFLVSSAVRRPDVNFFGIEIIRKYQLYAATRIAQRGLSNAITCCGDAKLVLRDFVNPNSVSTVHIFFPDPWWKTRHKKRTLFTPEFAAIVLSVLKPEGHLHFVTDVADYFAMVMELLDSASSERGVSTPRANLPRGVDTPRSDEIIQSSRFVKLPPPSENAPSHDMDYLTNFERKFRKEGRPIYRSLHQKRAQ